MHITGRASITEATSLCGMARSTFYRRATQILEETRNKKHVVPDDVI